MKKFCDSCGDPQEVVSNTPMPRRLPPEAKIAPIERISPEDRKKADPPPEAPAKRFDDDAGAKNPPRDIPRTVLRKIPPEGKSAPKSDASHKKNIDEPDSHGATRQVERLRREHDKRKRDRQVSEEPKPDRRTMVRTLVKERPIFSTILSLLLLIATAGAYFTVWKARRSPDRMLVKTSRAYLTALKEKKPAAAYALLSEKSRASCAQDTFAGLQETLSWNFDKIRIASMTPDRALVRYELLVSGRPAEQDWLHFVFEDGKWRRSYWWHLMPAIEEALAADDPASADARAAQAQEINPLDPLLTSYRCEAAYLSQNVQKAETLCRRTLDMVRLYPSRLGPDGELHIRRILAAVYREGLGDTAKALQQYQTLLGDPLLRGKHACNVRLAAADAYFALGSYDKSLEQFDAAKDVCRNDEEAAYLERAHKIISGKGGEDAVMLAQRHKMPGDKLSLLQWRIKARKDLARKLKTKARRYFDEESWEPRHVGGADYAVRVVGAGTEILSADVDLWTDKVKVNIHVQ